MSRTPGSGRQPWPVGPGGENRRLVVLAVRACLGEFEVSDIMRATGLGRVRVGTMLSRLTAAGFLTRVRHGLYVLPDIEHQERRA